MSELRGSIRWADGTYDSSRECKECGLETCPTPVHSDFYRVISSKKAREFEAKAFNNDIESETAC